jgi:ABC-2 type transport system ATP-binding protein
MKQKISVIAALVHNPKIWVLDEPLTGLDPQSSYQLKQVMKEHAKAGNTVFFSSHILDVVENLCDRCCIIKKGHLQGIYDIHELKANGESLEEIFMGVIGEISEVV